MFLCVTQTRSMTPQPTSGGHLHAFAFDKRCTQHQNMKNAWFGALGRGYIVCGCSPVVASGAVL